MRRLPIVLLSCVVVYALLPVSAGAQGRARTTVVRDFFDHSRYDRVLTRFVDSAGRVDYEGLARQADSLLKPYLGQLARANLSDMDRAERLAFWINAYNALTLALVSEHYPINTIWAITSGPPEPKEESPFELTVGTVADTARTLDEIEHEIIRERFEEPRIHFALVCAAVSCPRLRRHPYTGRRLDDQLHDQARVFFHDERKNRIPARAGRIELSPILKWYRKDFGPTTDALQRFIAPYFENDIKKKLAEAEYQIVFGSYDWALNDRAGE